jgi:hypothetical protein
MKKRIGKMLGSFGRRVPSRAQKLRQLQLESLEGRRLLAADLGLMHHNHLIAEDVNGDFRVTPLDALLVINAINNRGMGSLGGVEGEGPANRSGSSPKIDVSGDNFLSALDILKVINKLNAEGENNALIQYTYQITNLAGEPISSNSVNVGETFRVNVLVQDLRDPEDAKGIGFASIDLGVSNLDLVEFQQVGTARSRVTFGPEFVALRSGGEGGGIQITGEPSSANVADGQTFSLDSGSGPIVFEFDSNGAVSSGNRAVTIPSGLASFTDVANALVAAINAAPLGITATSNGQGVVGLPDTVVFDSLTSQLTESAVETDYFNEISASPNLLPEEGTELTGPVGPVLFFSVNFLATSPGVVTFTPNQSDIVGNDNLLFGDPDTAIPNELVIKGNPFTVTILADPTSPIARDDTVSSPEDTTYTFVGSTLFANDTVTAGRTLSLVSVDAIAGVTLGTLVGLDYTPPANFFGQDLVTYTIQDSAGLRSSATVTINVTPVNDPPVAVNDIFNVVEDQSDVTLNVLSNDNGGPGETTDVIRVTAVGVPSQGGSVRIAANGSAVIYTPPVDFIGTETFTYTIADQGNLTATATVTVNVEPLAVPSARVDLVTVAEDTTNNVIDVLANDRVNTGEEAILLRIATQPANGTATIDDNGTPNDLTDDTILYTPAPNFFGTDVFTYVMNDTSDPRGADSVGTVTVTVTDVNDPVILVDDQRTATEDVVATFPIAGLLANDSPGLGEVGKQTLTLTAVTAIGAGGSVAIVGSNVVYTPAPDFNGTFLFTYTAVDNGVPVSSGTATVTVAVAAVNDDPIAGPDTVATNEDTVRTIPVAELLANDVPGPPNESDQTLSITAVSPTSSQGGTVSLSGTTVTYTPRLDFNGVDTFTYTLTDSEGGTATGTVTVNVAPLNDAPIPGADSVVAFKDNVATIQVATLLANDLPGPPDEAGQTLTITSVTATANTNGTVVLNADGTISYTPTPGFTGSASFQYRVQDSGPNGNGHVNFATGTVNVTVQEFVPSAVSGTVWMDETRDGIINAAERRLGGVVVTLTGTSLGQTITPQTLLTLSDGTYSFDGLGPGTYTVSYVAPDFLIDHPGMADSYTVSIVEPGGVNAGGNNFAVLGVSVNHARILDQLASRYIMQDGSLAFNGAYFALGADNSLLWGANLGGYAGTDFSEAVLDGEELLLTVVDSARNVYTSKLTRGEFLTVRDQQGRTLVRVLGARSNFDWQQVDLAAPPMFSAARYLDSVDAIFDQEEW